MAFTKSIMWDYTPITVIINPNQTMTKPIVKRLPSFTCCHNYHSSLSVLCRWTCIQNIIFKYTYSVYKWFTINLLGSYLACWESIYCRINIILPLVWGSYGKWRLLASYHIESNSLQPLWKLEAPPLARPWKRSTHLSIWFRTCHWTVVITPTIGQPAHAHWAPE